MSQRIFTLTGYLFRRLAFSLTGLLYVLAALAYWRVFFSPTEGRTPEADLFILMIGLFGLALTFLVTLSVANRANHAAGYPILVRLPSRVEYLIAVMSASLLFALLLQAVMALVVLAQPGGPDVSFGRLLEVPPIWLSADIFVSVLALHATDLVMKNWSRVQIYGILAGLLFSQSVSAGTLNWVAARLRRLGNVYFVAGRDELGDRLHNIASWLSVNGVIFLKNTLGLVFWPFTAISDAVKAGAFTNAQAFAPTILLLYATILFMLAADLFATKDLHLVE